MTRLFVASAVLLVLGLGLLAAYVVSDREGGGSAPSAPPPAVPGRTTTPMPPAPLGPASGERGDADNVVGNGVDDVIGVIGGFLSSLGILLGGVAGCVKVYVDMRDRRHQAARRQPEGYGGYL